MSVGTREPREIFGKPPLIGTQPDAHVMVIADRVLNRRRHDADDAGLHRRRDRRDGNAEIAGALAIDVDAQLGLRFLEAVLDVGRAWNLPHRRHQLARQAVELVDLRAAHADLNRLLPERARLGQPERQARAPARLSRAPRAALR